MSKKRKYNSSTQTYSKEATNSKSATNDNIKDTRKMTTSHDIYPTQHRAEKKFKLLHMALTILKQARIPLPPKSSNNTMRNSPSNLQAPPHIFYLARKQNKKS